MKGKSKRKAKSVSRVALPILIIVLLLRIQEGPFGGNKRNDDEQLFFPLVLNQRMKATSNDWFKPKNILLDTSNITHYRFASEHCPSYSAKLCRAEWDMWNFVQVFVKPGDAVLELGARYGTTSCVISNRVGPTGLVVSVEPDADIHGLLQTNLQKHNCDNVHLVKGTLGNEPQFYIRHTPEQGEWAEYGQYTSTSEGGDKGVALPHISLPQLHQGIGRSLSVALIDCEGCLPSLADTGLFDEVQVILLEEDTIRSDPDSNRTAYDYWRVHFDKLGFRCAWFVVDSNKLPGGFGLLMALRHSVWVKGDQKYPSCCEYKRAHGVDPLYCSTCPIPGQPLSGENLYYDPYCNLSTTVN